MTGDDVGQAATRQREPGDDDLVPLGEMLFERTKKDAWAALSKHGLSKTRGPRGPFFECAAELEHEQFPDEPWLVEGILEPNAVGIVGGEPKATKTWAALEIGMAIATGTKAFGEFDTGEAAPVALFLVEDPRRSVRNRLRALAASRSMGFREATQNIYFQARTPISLQRPDDVSHLVASIRSMPRPPALVVLDPLRDLHEADENDSKEMGRIMGTLRALRDVLGASILVVHHAIKAGKDTSGRRPAQRLRGSSAIHGATDATLSFLDLTGDTRNVWKSRMHAETRGRRSAGYFALQLELEDDDHGGALEARWTFARDVKDLAPPTGGPPITDRQNAFLRFLRNRWEADSREGIDVRPLSTRDLAGLLHPPCSDKTAGADMKRLESLGRVTFADAGDGRSRSQRGWVYVPTDDEVDPFAR